LLRNGREIKISGEWSIVFSVFVTLTFVVVVFAMKSAFLGKSATELKHLIEKKDRSIMGADFTDCGMTSLNHLSQV